MSGEVQSGTAAVDVNGNRVKSAGLDLSEVENYFKDVKQEDLIRGATPDGIERRCLDLCRKFIGGTWHSASLADVQVARISGGLTNQLYQVSLAQSVTPAHNQVYGREEPRQVAIKFYMKKHFGADAGDEHERLNDIIISSTVSELGIGPKIYGFFAGGVIQAYYEHEQFRVKHQRDDGLLRDLLHILAHVHSLQVPIPKQTDWIMEQNRQNLEKLYREKDVIALSEKYGTRAFCEHHLMGELARLESITGKLNSPVVFCHVDFRGSNILVVGEENPRLVLCDFEYSSYGARASDMACLLAEWGREMLDVSVFEMPPQEVVEKVAGFYREGMEKYRPGYCDKEENSVEQITREIKVYMAANILFFVSFMLNQTSSIIDSLPFEEKNQFVFAEKLYINYRDLVRQLHEQGLAD